MANYNPNTSGLKKPFSKTNQPKNRGRKPSVLKKFIKDNGLTTDDISAAAKYVLPKTRAELMDMEKDNYIPLVMRLFAKAMLKDMKGGYLNNILKIFDRAVGKPKETKEVKTDNFNKVTIDTALSNMDEEQAKKMFFELQGKIEGEK